MEGIGAAAQDYRSVPQMPRCPSWWPDDQRNGEPCALKGASTVRGEALGRHRKRRLAPTLPSRRHGERKSVVEGKRGDVRVVLGGRRINTKKTTKKKQQQTETIYR